MRLKPRVCPMALVALMGATVAQAVTPPPNTTFSSLKSSFNQISPFVITLSGGPAWYTAGTEQAFYLLPGVEKNYTANKKTNLLGTGELFLGLERALPKSLIGQLGFAVSTTSDAKVSGSIWEYADPEFDNYIYAYKVIHTGLAIKGKILADVNQPVMPYISGSLGVGFNRAHAFERVAVIEGEIPAPPFAPNTATAFTYTVGVGLQRALDEHWKLGIGYEFADWGKSHLGRFNGQTLNTGLRMSHLYTNELQFGISFVN